MLRHIRNLGLTLIISLVSACAAVVPPTNVHQPMSARPAPLPDSNPANGSIYQVNNARLNLFSDRRALFVGDTLTVLIEEKTTASKASSSNASRAGSMEVSIPTITHFPGKSFQNAAIESETSNKFEGKGASASNNVFTGNLTVTVIEVLANGNLLVSGEKQTSINQGTEYVRFSGVVNPVNVNGANIVSSTKVADARLEYKSTGYIDEAQTMGWLARFFLSVLPF